MNLQRIRENKQLNTLLMHECDIYFYEEVRALQFVNNHEIYSMVCDAFAQDGSGGEYVFLEDGSIGFISSEGEVGRVAESVESLLTFLIHAGCISDFNCKHFYRNKQLLDTFCTRYVMKMRESYRAENRDWDEIRSGIAKELALSFEPSELANFAMGFYQAAIREPVFSCKYFHEGTEYICDSVLSDIVGMWIEKLVGMTKEEIESVN